jgi:hypothetical protein
MMGVSFTADKFGYYKVGDRSTYSKLEAIEWSKKTNKNTEWDFNRSVFDLIDWTKEPDMDLGEMYKARARQIRESYDYIVLWYSGGSDSHNLLLAWIDAGLKIDEIATTWNYEASGDPHDHYNAEITNVVLPDIKKLKDSGIEFNFRLVDISKLCMDLFDAWGNEYEYHVNFHLSVNNPAKHLMRYRIKEYRDMVAAGKKLCFVWGKEKPLLRYENGKHYFIFADSIDNTVGPFVQRNYNKGWYDELFYWTPDYPLIPVKQAHVIKNYLEHATDVNEFEPHNPEKFQINGYSKKLNMYLRDERVKTLLYPKWSNDIFCNGKAGSFTYSQRDEWFLKSNLDNARRYYQLVDSYYKIIDHDDTQRRRNVVPHYSPKYWLE